MSQFSGLSPIDTAKKCFAENLRDFGDLNAAPEKYNFYNGLANLAIAIEQMQTEITQIKQLVATLVNER
jgi:hypothetical protein